MIEGPSGPNRIKGQLPEGTVVGHKTGTSSRNETTNVLTELNDVGIVMLPDGRHFAIAVFVANSTMTDDETAAIIARISKTAWDHFTTISK
jgi:beta-lactamase class A